MRDLSVTENSAFIGVVLDKYAPAYFHFCCLDPTFHREANCFLLLVSVEAVQGLLFLPTKSQV